MGCNCNKRRGSSSSSRRARPTVGPRSVQRNVNNVTPQQLRALGFQGQEDNSQQNLNSRQLDAERKRIEKLRRQAIRRRLGN